MRNNDFTQLVQQAREADLLSYFQQSGYTIQRHGREYYVKEFAGLCIYPENNSWYHFYTNTGRANNSIDCLTHVLDRSFNQAVYELTGQDVTQKRAKDFPIKERPDYTSPPKKEVAKKEKGDIVMPEKSPDMRQLFAYFCKTRKIPSAIVEELVHADLLYQSQNNVDTYINGEARSFKNANAVFVHKNVNGDIVGGEIQGLNSFRRYKGMVSGTGDSVFTFTPFPSENGKANRAYIFESAIDLMSFYTFCDKKKIQGAMFVSMGGLKPTIPKKLQEEGIQIVSCVDNDDAGRRFEADNNFVRPEGVKQQLDMKGFKDWNELLVFRSENPNANLLEKKEEQKEIPKAAFNRRK